MAISYNPNSNLSSQAQVANRGLIIFAVMSAALMQVLDTTIVNVALPHMQGSLNATPDQISWTLTSYLVASAIVMPLTGYFSDKLGSKKYLLWSISGFTIASALCGMATSLSQIVAFRLLQGIFGAALVPLSQAILSSVYPPQELAKAMSIWATGIMIGPVLGPTIGGYLTDIANWRWTFYVNVPMGILSFVLAWLVVPDRDKKERTFDWLGFFFIALAIGALQYFLDRGNQEDWFSAHSMQFAAALAVGGFVSFVTYGYFKRGQTIFDLEIFKDWNFTIASLLILVLGVGLFGSMVILPLFLKGLLGYPVFDTGLMMTPRAICVMISMAVVGRFGQRFDARALVASGLLTCAIGTYMCTYYSLEVSNWWLVWPMMLQGLGVGMVFVPLSSASFATLPQKLRAEAAGVSSLLRTIGGSIGIALTLTVYTRHSQIAWNNLVGFVNPYNPNLVHYLQQLHLSPTSPLFAAVVSGIVAKQATMLAVISVFMFITVSFLVMLPFVFLLKTQSKKA